MAIASLPSALATVNKRRGWIKLITVATCEVSEHIQENIDRRQEGRERLNLHGKRNYINSSCQLTQGAYLATCTGKHFIHISSQSAHLLGTNEGRANEVHIGRVSLSIKL